MQAEIRCVYGEIKEDVVNIQITDESDIEEVLTNIILDKSLNNETILHTSVYVDGVKIS